LTLTLDNFRAKLADQIHTSVPLLYWLEKRGRNAEGGGMRMDQGGTLIRVPVIKSKNENAGSYERYDQLPLAPTDELTTAFESWSELATTIGISRREIRENSGQSRILSLLTQKVKIAELGLREELERQLVQGELPAVGSAFIQGNSGKDLVPLPVLVDPTPATGTVHNVNAANEAWWRNQIVDAAGATDSFAVVKADMSRLYNNCSKGNTTDFPDLILSDQFCFEKFESLMHAQQRYGGFDEERNASVGFQSIKFRGATWLWSELVPGINPGAEDTRANLGSADGTMFFLNSRWLELVVDSESNFVATPFEEPVNQTAIFSKILFMGQLMVTQRRKMGVYFDIDSDSWS
jgi:hypothetical protein